MRLILCLLALLGATPALACGPDTDCKVGNRTYRLYLPDTLTEGPVGALVFAHGYRGTAAGAMRNGALRAVAGDLGMALVVLQSAGDDWQIANTPHDPGRAEVLEYGYVRDVLADVGRQIALDPARSVMSGFSAGGMLTWTLACGMSEAFAGFVPMSGTFWAPVPATCDTPPASVIHIHGTEDQVVPLTGRAIGETRQGDVGQALAMYARHGGFTATGRGKAPGAMTCRFSVNSKGQQLDFCTFTGGHSFSTKRLGYAVRRLLGPD